MPVHKTRNTTRFADVRIANLKRRIAEYEQRPVTPETLHRLKLDRKTLATWESARIRFAEREASEAATP